MNRETIEVLDAINRRFYRERASEFSATRERPWRGWTDLFERFGDLLPGEPKVLDVGCGNGRFARFLIERGLARFTYFGVDASPLALRFAAERLAELDDIHFFEHDVITSEAPLPFDDADFDLVVLFGVLHHVPGRANRARLLRELSPRLRRGGLLAYAVWRFDRFERFRKKLVPWSELEDFRIDEAELEPGDYVMTWGGGEPSYRYCHALSDEEADTLAESLALKLVDEFDGDDALNRYFVFQNT